MKLVKAMRKVPRDAPAKMMILEYIRDRGPAYPSDMAADLDIPYFTVVELIAQLARAGEIEAAVEEH